MDRDRFEAIAAAAGIAVKGKKNPYCSANGHMFALLSAEDGLCLRFEEARRAELAEAWGHGPVKQYGAVMRGYVALPADVQANQGEAADYLADAQAFVETLKPK